MTQANVLAQLGSPSGPTFRNRIINGAMVISQRNGSTSVTGINGKVYPVDRFPLYCNVASKCTAQQSTDVPAGFTNSILVTSTSAYTVGSGDALVISQDIEGYNLADWNWGTANAKAATLSFWVKSSLTGTFGGSIGSGLTSYSYPYTYTITAANTWEYKTVAIAAPTTGSSDFSTTNGSACVVRFGLGCGSTFSGTAGSWSANNYFSATGATSVVGTSGATFYITGVQLEVGEQATGYEYVNYQTSLANCQRYFEVMGTGTILTGASSGNYGHMLRYAVTKRATPTLTKTGNYSVTTGNNTQTITAFASMAYETSTGCTINATPNNNIGVTNGQCIYYGESNNNIQASAEL
jgi:hypothetical protein